LKGLIKELKVIRRRIKEDLLKPPLTTLIRRKGQPIKEPFLIQNNWKALEN